MNTMTKIAMTSAISMSLLAGNAFAADMNKIQKAVDDASNKLAAESRLSKNGIPCPTGASKLVNAGTKAGKQEGLKAEPLYNALTRTVFDTAKRSGFTQNGCMTQASISELSAKAANVTVSPTAGSAPIAKAPFGISGGGARMMNFLRHPYFMTGLKVGAGLGTAFIVRNQLIKDGGSSEETCLSGDVKIECTK